MNTVLFLIIGIPLLKFTYLSKLVLNRAFNTVLLILITAVQGLLMQGMKDLTLLNLE